MLDIIRIFVTVYLFFGFYEVGAAEGKVPTNGLNFPKWVLAWPYLFWMMRKSKNTNSSN